MRHLSRRRFVGGAAGASASFLLALRAFAADTKFKVGVISDEISQDFDHACYVIAKDFGLHWVELREVWGKNLQVISDAQIAEAQKILAKYSLQVTDISSPLYKVNWPGAPVSQYGTKEDMHGADEVSFKHQDEVLERAISLAKQFKTNKVRCFDFWRIDDIKPYRAGVPSRNLSLNWDPGNAVMRGELDAYPGGWDALPKDRIHHCHVKNAIKDSAGKTQWSPVDKGYIDWTAQFRALAKIGYSDAVNLETHWRGGGTPEECTRISWAGMKTDLDHAKMR